MQYCSSIYLQHPVAHLLQSPGIKEVTPASSIAFLLLLSTATSTLQSLLLLYRIPTVRGYCLQRDFGPLQ